MNIVYANKTTLNSALICLLILLNLNLHAQTDKEVNAPEQSPQNGRYCMGVKQANNGSTVTHEHKTRFDTKDTVAGVISHRWYGSRSPQNTPEQLFSDEGTRQYYLTTYGFEIFVEFPDYPRWEVSNPDPNQVRDFKLKVAEWTDKNPRYTEFMEKKMQELKNN